MNYYNSDDSRLDRADHLRTEQKDREMEAAFYDTEETIHPPTPEEDAAYYAEAAEIKADAEALLATVRHLLTGAEIDMLEDAAGEDASIDMGMLDSLRNQFYAQITNYKDGRTSA